MYNISNRGSQLKVSILNALRTCPRTAQGIHDILYEQWDLKQIQNTLSHMIQGLEISGKAMEKSTSYTLKRLGENYLEKFIELLNK